MDLDPTLYSPHNDTPPRSPSPPAASTPLPPVTLPSAPRPSVSPSVSRVFQKKQSDSPPTMSGGLDLSVPPSPRGGRGQESSLRVGPQDDARDTASARDNILNLVSAGQRALGSPSSFSTPSLAMFMGGGAQRRTHRVGTGMTEQEKEETERLEREMAATRAKWGDKGAQAADAEPPRGGMSLADLMKGGKSDSTSSPVAAKVAQRFQPETSRDTSAGSAAPAQTSVEEPAAQQPLVEAKNVSRSPPAAEVPAPEKTTSAPVPTAESRSPHAAASAEPETATLPRSASFGLGAGNTLTRLQSSNIVADRLKWTEAMAQPGSADAPPAAAAAPPSPEKRRSVLERWGRDEPNSATPASPSRQRSFVFDAGAPREELRKSPEVLDGAKGHEKATSPAAAPASSPPLETAPAAKAGYTKPTWSAAPIGVKDPSKPLSPPPVEDEPTSPEVRHTRGVALPGLSSAPASKPVPSPSARPAPLASPSAPPESPVRTRTTSTPTAAAMAEPPASPGGRPSVRAAAMRWGQTAAQSAAEKSEALQALKASYGVKVVPARGQTMPAPGSLQQQQKRSEFDVPPKSKSVEVPAPAPALSFAREKKAVEPAPAPAPAPASVASPAPLKPSPSAAPTPKAAPAASPASAKPAARTLVDDVVSAVLAPRDVAHLPPGETLSLDIFHLNSPSDDPHPIDHNHMLFSSEVVGIVYRAAAPAGADEDEDAVLTRTWVWRGRDAQPTPRTEERIARLAEKTGTRPVEVQAGKEGAELAEAFAGQLTVCRGRRDDFDHLAAHMFLVQSHDGAAFVEEADVSIRTLCSGYATVFSSLGEVYAWLGEGSTDLERHTACEFAESLADGRSVAVLAEGEETALFWHQLAADAGAEYASAHYWRYRSIHPQTASLVRFSPSGSTPFSLVPSLELSPSHVSLLDGGFAEHWVVVPEAVLADKKGDVELALEAAEKLSAKWEERGFGARTPFHVLLTPSLIPRDLPFLSRSLDFSPLNDGAATPRKMRVYTAQEAREELL
ncbi:hypothetical protein DMC30DRAFT_444549 [Rhodotorula diobovata]|uniref:Gelsolin-like domain-containing protein n=1 Tax=Rhodotorula diobovata TaxID=5288 RepID=A0A5C5G2J8_9BASI|nr:hypothetical protein DMC30DRAFT_444549 [Rhodotorula diobovata]